jgi:thymidine phosphorylase
MPDEKSAIWMPQELLRRKRMGQALTPDQIGQLVSGISDGRLGDAQVGAFAMAVCALGMNAEEITALTLAMRDSGTVLDWHGQGFDRPILDKHSTGGVGDLVSLMLGPMLAACGAFVPMLSGRGLGHTGGTLDKLESIPGYQTQISVDRLRQVVRETGVAIVGAGADLAPADRRLYSIRDITGTVESIALITASILSKKLAAGTDALILDIKTGNGASMPSLEQARSLALSLVQAANLAGLPTRALISDMSQPLAPAVGNALELQCTLSYLRGEARPARLHQLTLHLGAELLCQAGPESGRRAGAVAAQPRSGHGSRTFCAHGESPRRPRRSARARRCLSARGDLDGARLRAGSGLRQRHRHACAGARGSGSGWRAYATGSTH